MSLCITRRQILLYCSNEALQGRSRPTPGRDVLQGLLETMYAASLKTEEGEGIAFHIAFLDPSSPDPDPPPRVRSNRWKPVELGQRVPFSVEQLTKLAKASDPRTSSFATYFDADGLFVWGLIDQGNRYYEYLNYDSESTQAFRPGSFQASIEGPAHVTAWMDFEKVAELRGTQLAGTALEALDRGPLRDALDPGLEVLVAATFERQEQHGEAVGGIAKENKDNDGVDGDNNDEEEASSSKDNSSDEDDDATNEANCEPDGSSDGAEEDAGVPLPRYIANSHLEALKRILIRAQNYGHGGAVLMTIDPPGEDLAVKYSVDYPRLRDALINFGAHRLDFMDFSDEIHELLDDEHDEMPIGLYLDEAIAEDELNDARSEIEGVVWFISLLSRVDGLVLMTPDLRVIGFGVEIMVRDEPHRVVRANDAEMSSVSEVDPTHYGTRHRSMMRYCSRHPGSVGFVVSQDGVVRGITRVGDATVMWDNLKIQQYRVGNDPDRSQTEVDRRAAQDRRLIVEPTGGFAGDGLEEPADKMGN